MIGALPSPCGNHRQERIHMSSILDQFRLNGKTALVTGASFGLGRAMAEGLAEAGADVVVASRSLENLREVEETIRGLGRRCERIACDVANADEIRSMVAQAREVTGRVDIAVNNAGTAFRSPAESFPEAEWRRVIDVNMHGVWFCCQETGLLMIEQGGGKIINTASLLSFQGGITVPAYAAAKGAVGTLTMALSNEWARHNVQVNAVAPGYFVTEMTKPVREDPVRAKSLLDRIPAGRYGDPSDLKGAVVFLASSASDYVSGHLLVVDGGWMGR